MHLTLLIRLPNGHSAQHVGDALITTFSHLPVKLRKTTWDQGNEMFHHERIEAATGLKIYFADPHSPWQGGSNENANGLVRQYLPKGNDLSGTLIVHWPQAWLRQVAKDYPAGIPAQLPLCPCWRLTCEPQEPLISPRLRMP